MKLDTPFPIIMSPDGGNGRVKPLGNADYYVGFIGTTPYSNPSDRTKIFYQDENGIELETVNPVKTNSSGAFVNEIGSLIVPYNYEAGASIQIKGNGKLYTYKYLGKEGSASNQDSFKNIDAAKEYILNNPIEGEKVEWMGYYEESDGGSNWGIVRIGPHTDDGGSIFSVSSNIYIEANLKGGRISIRKFGVKDDSTKLNLVTDNAPQMQKLVDYLAVAGGGEIYTPPVDSPNAAYGLSTNNDTRACVFISSNRISMTGSGASSLYRVYQNKHVPFHFSNQPDLTIPQMSGDPVERFECSHFAIAGTGVYENLSLALGRGILFRNAKDVNVHHMWIDDMSMIGICSEGGDGYFRCNSNNVHNCKYTAINYNGRCYLSMIKSNICTGSNGDVNSISIQACGPSTIAFNQVFGSNTSPQNCGGIMWGEGNFDGIGTINNNTVKGCRYGVLAIYHGQCNIHDNIIINCTVVGGISTSGTSTDAFTVANSDNQIHNNTIINCTPYGINCSAKNTRISNNKVRTFTPIKNPSAPTEPGYIFGVTTQTGIRVRETGCSVTNNDVSGCIHGITTTILQKNGIIGGNQLSGNTNDYSIESQTSGVFAASGHAIIERELSTPQVYRERIFRANLPYQGYFPVSSQWTDPTPSIGQPVAQIVLFAQQSTTTAAVVAGGTTIPIVSTAAWLSSGPATVCGVELDNGVWLWTTIASISSPNVILSTPIPAGRSVLIGANICYNSWRPLANLA